MSEKYFQAMSSTARAAKAATKVNRRESIRSNMGYSLRCDVP
jgi:hypothetical protein